MSQPYERTGVLEKESIPLPSKERLSRGPVAIFECPQEIPCNPCVDVCPVSAVSIPNINAPPHVDYDKCVGCGECLKICPGLAIFMIDISKKNAVVTLPYEFLPLPSIGETVDALSRKGEFVCSAKVVRIITSEGKTTLIAVEVPKEFFMDVRNIRVRRGLWKKQ